MKGCFSQGVKQYFWHYSGLTDQCWQEIFLNFIASSFSGICFFLSFYFVTELKLNISTAGSIVSVYGLGRILGGVVGGKLSDKISANKVSICSLAIQTLTFFAFIKIKSVYFLSLNLMLSGIAAYSFITSNTISALAQCHHNEHMKLKVINILYTASNLGIGFSACFVSLFAPYGFSKIFLFSACLMSLSWGYLVFSKKRKNSELMNTNNQNRTSETEKILMTDENKNITRLVLICLFFVGLIIAQRSTTYTIYLNEIFPRMGAKSAGLLFALNSIIIVIFQTPLVNLLNDINKIVMIGIGAFLIGFGMFMLLFSYTFWIAAFACIIYTCGEMLFFSIAQLVCYENGGNKKGFTLGVFRSVYAASTVIGPILGGYIYHQCSGNILWYLCGAVGLLSLLFFIHYRKSY